VGPVLRKNIRHELVHHSRVVESTPSLLIAKAIEVFFDGSGHLVLLVVALKRIVLIDSIQHSWNVLTKQTHRVSH
jgi:hypothetical protein